jgi:hypothetical protein
MMARPQMAAFASQFVLALVPHIDSHALLGAEHGGPALLEAAAGVTNFLVGAVGVGRVGARQAAAV